MPTKKVTKYKVIDSSNWNTYSRQIGRSSTLPDMGMAYILKEVIEYDKDILPEDIQEIL